MPNYRRLISYIYAYEGGIKGKNTGYAKIEVRGDQCRIQVNVKKVFVGSSDTGVYLLSPGKEILIGKLFVRGGNGEFRMNVSATDVESSGYGIDQCYGLTIHDVGSTWQSYTTIWEDAVAQAAEVQLEHVTAENIRRQEAERKAGEIPRTIEEIPEPQDPYPITTEIQRTLEQEEMRLQDIQPWEQEETAEQPASQPETAGENGNSVSQPGAAGENGNSASQPGAAGENGNSALQPGAGGTPGAGMPPAEIPAADGNPFLDNTSPPYADRPSDMTILPQGTGAPTGTTVSLSAGVPTDTTVSLDSNGLNGADKYIPGNQEPETTLESPAASGNVPAAAGSQLSGSTPAPAAGSQLSGNPPVPAAGSQLSGNPPAPAAGSQLSGSPPAPAATQLSGNPPAAASPQVPTPSPAALSPNLPRARRKNEDLWAEIEDEEVLRLLDQKEQEAKASMNPGTLWSRLQRNYSKVLAFEYDHGCEILSIRPQDIGLLPREIWVYGNNSFLLHGYYNYRHLILARLNTPNGKPRYLLGVPGHYYSNEKYMASMFGFPHFVLAKKQPDEDGRFGYWYTDIRL